MFAEYAHKLLSSTKLGSASLPMPAPAGQNEGRSTVRPKMAFRDYDAADRTTVIQLLAQGRSQAYRRAKQGLFDWQCDQNPHGADPFAIGTLESSRGEEIVATNGFMPAKILYQGKRTRAAWSCDTFVSSKYRGCGFGSALIRRVSEHSPVMLGYGISDMSDPIFERQGWALHPGTSLLFFHIGEPGLKGAIKRIGTRASATLRRLGKSASGAHFEMARHDEDFGQEVDDLWLRSAPTYFSAVERDAAYMNWKYRCHPSQTYSWYGAYEAGRLRGLLVARHSPESSVLVDYCGPANEVDLMGSLVRVATADLAARGTMRVRCETTHPEMLAALRGAGFIGSRYQPRFRVRTNLPGDQRALEGWFLMPGDSDGDLLSAVDATVASDAAAIAPAASYAPATARRAPAAR
jgi:hypothetical protein